MMEMMEDPILSIHDLYPQTIGQSGPITTFILEGTKLKVPEVGMYTESPSLIIFFVCFLCLIFLMTSCIFALKKSHI